MGRKEKQAYLEAIRRRYRKSTRKQKAKILDEFCLVCEFNRKYAIRILRKAKRKKQQRRGRKPRYEAQKLLPPLQTIWLAADQPCSKRLKAALPYWLPHYETAYSPLTDNVRGQLLSLSPATLDRLLKPTRIKHPRKGLSGTKPGRLLKNQIPIKTDHWDVTRPGFLEADTVAHCGNSLAGNFAWSLTLTDIHTAWTEIRATWNKGSHGVIAQIKEIEKSLPFEILGFDCDNGSEFLNHHLVRYFTQEKNVQFTRSRPYRKNDNAHVEQKNWTHVRNLFGYDRIDDTRVIDLMNDLYKQEWSLYRNYFCPSMKLIEKKKVNSKYFKRYDEPQTPYQRLMAGEFISEEKKQCLTEQYQSLNPFDLKGRIEQKLKHIFKFISVTSFVRQRL